METALLILLGLLAVLQTLVICLIAGAIGLGGWWLWKRQEQDQQEQEKIKKLVGQTWQMGGGLAAQVEKDLAAADQAGLYGRSRKTYAP